MFNDDTAPLLGADSPSAIEGEYIVVFRDETTKEQGEPFDFVSCLLIYLCNTNSIFDPILISISIVGIAVKIIAEAHRNKVSSWLNGTQSKIEYVYHISNEFNGYAALLSAK